MEHTFHGKYAPRPDSRAAGGMEVLYMVEVASYSDQGGRDYNEDSRLVVDHGNSVCAIVADGLGGHGGGKLASMTAVGAVKDCIEAGDPRAAVRPDDINAWFDTANGRVLEMQTRECEMKTTMALVYLPFDDGGCYAAHLGDTRIYHFIDGKLSYMSFDHSVSRMSVLAGEIGMEDIRFHADRNRLLKAIGKCDEAVPEMKELDIDRSVNNAILICTDGFWEYVTEEQMEETLANAGKPREWLEAMRRNIKRLAKKNNDNNTAIALFIR